LLKRCIWMNKHRAIIQLLPDLAGKLLQEGRTVRVKVTGTSMYPFLRDGNLVTVEPVSADRIMRGMVVVARVPDAYVVHRVIGINREGSAILKGDFYRKIDSPVAPRQIIGIVTGVSGRHSEQKERKVRRLNPGIISLIRPFCKILYRINAS